MAVFNSRFNKRGQEGVSSWGVIIGVVLLVIVAALVIMWFYGTFDRLEVADVLPSDIEKVTQACLLALRGDLYTTYCKDFNEVEDNVGDTQYINCEFPPLKTAIDRAIASEGLDAIDCVDDDEKIYCTDLKNAGRLTEKTIVNGKPCSEYDVMIVTTGSPDNDDLTGEPAAARNPSG